MNRKVDAGKYNLCYFNFQIAQGTLFPEKMNDTFNKNYLRCKPTNSTLHLQQFVVVSLLNSPFI